MTRSNKSVIDGKLVSVSASSIALWERCRRAWHTQYVKGLRSPPSKSQATGTHIHSSLENFLLDGVRPSEATTGERLPPSDQEVALASADLASEWLVDELHVTPGELPDGVTVEAGLIDPIMTIAGVDFVGFTDIADDRDPEHPVIYDAKTCKTFRYMPKADEWRGDTAPLSETIQPTIYAAHRLLRHPEAEAVRVCFFYMRTEKVPDLRVVEFLFTREHINERLKEITKTIEGMKATAALPATEQAEPNWDACHAYGGCWLRKSEHCRSSAGLFGLEPDAPTPSAPDRRQESFREALIARKAG